MVYFLVLPPESNPDVLSDGEIALNKGDGDIPCPVCCLRAVARDRAVSFKAGVNPVQGVRAFGVRSTWLAWGVPDVATRGTEL